MLGQLTGVIIRYNAIRYDTIEEFNVDSEAKYSRNSRNPQKFTKSNV